MMNEKPKWDTENEQTMLETALGALVYLSHQEKIELLKATVLRLATDEEGDRTFTLAEVRRINRVTREDTLGELERWYPNLTVTDALARYRSTDPAQGKSNG